MNKLLCEAESYLQVLLEFLGNVEPDSLPALFIVPPFTVLREVSMRLEGFPVLVGAQNMHWEHAGSYTCKISPLMLKDCGVRMVELGHSERRSQCGETDFLVNKKPLSAERR